jgi:hypothetical protein
VPKSIGCLRKASMRPSDRLRQKRSTPRSGLLQAMMLDEYASPLLEPPQVGGYLGERLHDHQRAVRGMRGDIILRMLSESGRGE